MKITEELNTLGHCYMSSITGYSWQCSTCITEKVAVFICKTDFFNQTLQNSIGSYHVVVC